MSRRLSPFRIVAVAVTFALAGAAYAKPIVESAPWPHGGVNLAKPNLDELLARFAKAPGISAHFREEKHLAILDQPLVNEGTIHFAPPGRLVRHTTKPLASTLLIDGGQLKFGDAEGHQSLDLGANPVARAFVDSFLLLLAGDKAGLDRLFTMTLDKGTETGKAKDGKKAAGGSLQVRPAPASARQESWKLTLVPRQSPMNKLLTNLVLRGQGLVLEELEIRETSGDWSRTLFTEVDVAHVYSPAEQASVFRIPSR